MQRQPNPIFNIPQHRVNIKYYDLLRTILIISTIMITLIKH